MERIMLTDTLPDSFFQIAEQVYQGRSYRHTEDPAYVMGLLRQHQASHQVVLYTDHQSVRLVGIFPAEDSIAQFAFWESSSAAGSQQAFQMLEADARERGCTQLSGPTTFNTFHRYRLRIDQPEWAQFAQEPVNPPEYVAWLRQWGYSESMRFESRLVRAADVPTFYTAKSDFISGVAELPFRFVTPTPEIWQEREQDIFTLVDAMFRQNPGYQPISIEQFRLLYNADYAAKLCPYSSVFFEIKETGQLVAMSLCLPNYRPLGLTEAPVFARDFPLLNHRTLLVKSIGVHPDFRGRKLMNYLGGYAMQSFAKKYDDAIFCLMRDDNPSLSFTNGLPHETCHYALFGKVL